MSIERKADTLALAIARGNVKGSQSFGAYGKRATAGVTPEGLLWANGDWSIPDSAGEVISIQSTSVEDSASGTGIQKLHVHYLDPDLVLRSEEVTLNGTTSVLTAAAMRFVECSHISAVGSTKAAVGTITFTNVAKTAIYNELDPAEVRCTSSLRMVPKNKRAVIKGLTGSSISTTADASAIISIGTSYFSGHDFTDESVLIPLDSIGIQNSSETIVLPVPIVVPQGTLIGMLCSTNKAATVSGSWFGWLEDNN